MNKFNTGLPSIDVRGDPVKRLGVIMALSGTGKSFMATMMASRMVQSGCRVLFIAVGDSESVVERRMDACLRGVSADKTSLICWVVPMNTHLAAIKESYAQTVEHGWAADIVIIDGLEGLGVEDLASKPLFQVRHELLDEVLEWLEHHDMIGMVTLQANRRSIHDEVITPEISAEFECVRKISDFWSMNANENDRRANTMRLCVLRRRRDSEDERFTVYLKTDMPNCSFSEITEDEYNREIARG